MDFTPEMEHIWNKGRKIPGSDDNVWRLDVYDSKIQRNEYGNRRSRHGWEIDHIPNGGEIYQIFNHYNGKIMSKKATVSCNVRWHISH